ncbi:MAG: DUF6128 domain-containing protein [Wujia sp.]
MQQGRWVSYIYRYRNNVRCENAGFIKVQRIMYKGSDEARIQIGLKLLKQRACKCKVYLLYNNHASFLTEISVRAGERDTIVKWVEVPWEAPLRAGISFASYDGLVFLCDDGEFMAGLWHEDLLIPEEVVIEDKLQENHGHEDNLMANDEVACEDIGKVALSEVEANVQESIAQDKQKNVVWAQKSNVQNTQERVAQDMRESEQNILQKENEKTDACVEMMNTYPKLPLFADSQFLECVKIVPQDIGKLAMSNWKLGVNSFLSHGYYHYRYLMLGKVKFDKGESYVIGVPGVFTNKEKYLANMFGFNVFIPAKKTKIMTGNFGYWISEVARE